MSLYRFDSYRGSASRDERNKAIASLSFVCPDIDDATGVAALERASAIARGVNMARDLGNEPGKSLTPAVFADRAVEVAAAAGLEVEVLGPEELAALGAEAMLAVGGGSTHPCLLYTSQTARMCTISPSQNGWFL